MKIVDEALKLTSTDRLRHYGHPIQNFGNIATAVTGYLRATGKMGYDTELSVRDVAWIMVLTKAIRDGNMPKEDNLVDTVGYMICVEKCEAYVQDGE